ncbi:MAG: thiamine phosphate synthase [Burkholderiales bacterium]
MTRKIRPEQRCDHPTSMKSDSIRGLYAVTPDEIDTRALAAKVRAALSGGAKFVQYRNKTATAAQRLEQAGVLLELCRQYGARFIVNDHLDLASRLGADGLHLGAEDGPIADARKKLGAGKIIGVSCYDSLSNAVDAQRQDADYVAFGSFFPSGIKPEAVRAPLALLREAKQRLAIPVVAIGGITLATAPQLIAAGADGVAVISALFAAPDIKLAAQRFTALFDKP